MRVGSLGSSSRSTSRRSDKKMQELFELRLGNMTMAEYEKKFLGLLKYVRFIGNE
jgi:hypothetical protein